MKKVIVFLTMLCMLCASAAQAALPTEATTAFSSLSTAVTDILAAVWPVVAAVLVGFVTIKLFKRGGNKV